MAFQPFAIFGRALRRGLGSGGRAGGGQVYLLLDQFTTPRAAGSVNGTPAEPTGQTRTVTDGNSVLSITGSVASFATGGVGSGDPGLWYPSTTRVLGTAFLVSLNVASGSSGGAGWDSNQAGIVLDGYRFVGANLQMILNGATISVGTYTEAAAYSCCFILRSSSVGGIFWFVKGGSEYPKWTLMFLSTTNTGAAFAAIQAPVGTTSVFTADNARIPVTLYIPQPLAYDTFTRANGALGNTETSGPDSQVLSALAWAFTAGIWTISTNAALCTPVVGSEVIVNGAFAADTDWQKGSGWAIAAGVATGTTASSDLSQTVAPLTVGTWYRYAFAISGFAAGTVQAVVGGYAAPTRNANSGYQETARAGSTAFLMRGAGYSGNIDNVSCKPLTLAELFSTVVCSTADVLIDVAIPAQPDGRQVGIVVNLDSTSAPANFIIVYLDGKGNVQIDECVAGTYTAKQTTAITFSASAVLRVIRDGTSLRAFYNNAAVGVAQTMTSNTAKNHGMFSTAAFNTLDNLTIWPRGSSGEFATLDSF